MLGIEKCQKCGNNIMLMHSTPHSVTKPLYEKPDIVGGVVSLHKQINAWVIGVLQAT